MQRHSGSGELCDLVQKQNVICVLTSSPPAPAHLPCLVNVCHGPGHSSHRAGGIVPGALQWPQPSLQQGRRAEQGKTTFFLCHLFLPCKCHGPTMANPKQPSHCCMLARHVPRDTHCMAVGCAKVRLGDAGDKAGNILLWLGLRTFRGLRSHIPYKKAYRIYRKRYHSARF